MGILESEPCLAIISNGKIVFDDELMRETHADLLARGIISCDAACQNASEKKCICACNYKNHGKSLKEEIDIEKAYEIPELSEVVIA